MSKPFKRSPAAVQAAQFASSSVPAMLLAAVCRWTSRLKAIWRLCLCSSAAVVLVCSASPVHAQPSNANSVTAAADRINDFRK